MEHVDGVPITVHALAHRLDVRRRLKLFLRVCRAVEAAHRNLIVHRDIKPSNILVSADGEVKLLDFGIAKLLDEDDAGATIGVYTPDYAAPEQISGGAITTATDVYGLGVLLHELLLGLRPDGSPTRRPSSRVNRSRASRRQRPCPAPRNGSHLRGDLVHPAQGARTRPQRRYPSAGALADDIECFSTIASRRTRRRACTGPSSSATAAACGHGAIPLGIFAALSRCGRRTWREGRAREHGARFHRHGIRCGTRASAARAAADARGVGRTGAAPAAATISTRHDTRRRAAHARRINLSLSNFARAEAMFAEAATWRRPRRSRRQQRASAARRHDTARRPQCRGDARGCTRNSMICAARPRPRCARIERARRRRAGDGAPDAAIAHRRRNHQPRRTSSAAGVEARQALDVGCALNRAFPQAVAVSIAARMAARRTLRGRPLRRGAHQPGCGDDGVGDKPGSEAHYRELLRLKRHIYTAPHDAIARALRDLASIVLRAEKYAEAESLLNEALAMQRQVFGEDHREVAVSYDSLGEIMVAQRRFAEADAAYRAALAVCERARISEEVCPRARNNLGMSFYRQDRLENQARDDAGTGRTARVAGQRPSDRCHSPSTLANVASNR
jgi:serine/threonine-protein kinase